MITLKTLHMATAQEVFDQCANHLLTQNKVSIDDNGHCMYRGLGGLKCAAGCFIADDEYHMGMEGIAWKNLKEAPARHSELIQSLQLVHDIHPVKEWKEQLEIRAKSYGLSDSVLNNYQIKFNI